MNEWNHSNDQRYDTGYPPGFSPDPGFQSRRKRKWIAGLLSFMFPGLGYFYLGLMVKGIAIMLLIALDITAIVFSVEQLNNVLFIVLLSFTLMIIYFYNLFDAIQSTDAVNDRLRYPGYPATPYYGMGGGRPTTHPITPPRTPMAPSPDPMEPVQGAPGGTGSAGHGVRMEPGHREPGFAPDPMSPPLGPQAEPHRSINASGLILLVVGVVVLLLVADIGITDWLFHSAGSMVGAVLLIGAGIGLWFWEMRGGHRRKS